jgi:hypothetical protein
MPNSSVITQEFNAIQTSLEVLEPLDATQRQFAVAMILSRLGLGVPTGSATGSVPPGSAASQAGISTPTGGSVAGVNGMNVKEFLKHKAPTTDLERFICLAYFLMHGMDTPSFTTREITKLNADAHGTDFSNAAATAMNAVTQSRYLSRAGGGKKRITTRGEAVVEALPDRAKVKDVLASAPRRSNKKRPSKKKTAK